MLAKARRETTEHDGFISRGCGERKRYVRPGCGEVDGLEGIWTSAWELKKERISKTAKRRAIRGGAGTKERISRGGGTSGEN